MIITPGMQGLLRPFTALPPASALGVSGAGAAIYEIEVVGSHLYAVGDFTSVIDSNGTHTGYNRVARLDLLTMLWDSWAPVVDNGYCVGVLVDAVNGVCYVSGSFSTCAAGTSRKTAASFDTTSAALSSWNPSTNAAGFVNGTNCVADDGTWIYLGGYFGIVNVDTVPANRLLVARFHRTTGAVDTWDANIAVGTAVREVYPIGSDIYVIGDLRTVGATTRNQGFAVANTGAPATLRSWNPNASTTSGHNIAGLLAYGSDQILVGLFTTLNGGTTRTDAGVVSASSGTLSNSFDPSAGAAIDRVRSDGTNYFFGGRFTSFLSNTRQRCAKTDGSLALDSTFNPTINNHVYAMELYPGYVILAGAFTTVNGQSRNAIAVLDWNSGAVI